MARLLKDERTAPSAHTHTTANDHGQKAWSGLKYALNKLSRGERGRWRERYRERMPRNKGGRSGRSHTKIIMKKWHRDRGRTGTRIKAMEDNIVRLYQRR